MIIPIPTDEKSDYMSPLEIDYERIREYMNVLKWKCPACGLTNFGRNQGCADWKCKETKSNGI